MIKNPKEPLGNHDVSIDDSGNINFNRWVKSGGMMINRDTLDASHPESTFNLLKDNGLEPADYGIGYPQDEFSNWSRTKLINEIMQLRSQLGEFVTL